jgi:DUF1680 family protein
MNRLEFLRTSALAGTGVALGLGFDSPTEAAVKPLENAVPFTARPLPLTAVRLTGGPLRHAQELDREYLLSLEPDRMLAHLRERAGLKPKAEGYGGWDGGGKNLTGHIAGHYLSAVSLMYAATGDNRFKERADYLVREMDEIQKKNGDGYVGGLMDGGNVDARVRFKEVSQGNIRSGGFDLNGLWSPWYVQHKIYAGLRDAYRWTGNRTALEVEVRFAAWAESIVGKLDAEQTQKMLRTEFGGMNEVLAHLYADAGDKRWLTLADKFEHHAVVDPLSKKEDLLGGLHGNTQVPKLLGSLARYVHTGDPRDGTAARFFWDAVVEHHSFATGGHGKDEYFGPPDEISNRLDGRTSESCNVYNMLKFARILFALEPNIKYADYMERALFNHVLGSIDPEDGRTCYMVPVGRGVQHEYQDMLHNFTCCVGSGMESHALHGDGIYYESKDSDRLWVNLYTPSTAEWKAAGASLTMETKFPESDSATLTLKLKKSRDFMLSLRRPAWAGEGFAVSVNGEKVQALSEPGTYIDIKRTWKSGDIVSLTLPKTLHAEPTPDNPRRVALLWGPLVLSGDLGPEAGGDDRRAHLAPPVFVTADRPLQDWLKPAVDKPGAFRSESAGRNIQNGQSSEVDFVPFYRLHRRRYAAYWDLYTPEEWEQKAADAAREREKQQRLEAATVGYAQPGEMQPERDFNQQGEETEPDHVMGQPGRRGKKWFSFDLPVDPTHPMALRVTYTTEERQKRTFTLLVDGQRIGEQVIERAAPGSNTGHFFDVTYPIPELLIREKKKATIRFEATSGSEIAAVFGIRMLRADAPL